MLESSFVQIVLGCICFDSPEGLGNENFRAGRLYEKRLFQKSAVQFCNLNRHKTDSDGPLHEIKEGKYTVRVYGDLRGNVSVMITFSEKSASNICNMIKSMKSLQKKNRKMTRIHHISFGPLPEMVSTTLL